MTPTEESPAAERRDVLAIGAHPDDVEVFMGGTAAKLADRGLEVLLVDLCSGEPARHAPPGERGEQAARRRSPRAQRSPQSERKATTSAAA